jgi:hypothetical protein
MSNKSDLEPGKRYLLRRLFSRGCEEHLVTEVSPSGKRFKSNDLWLSRDDFYLEEELPPKVQP